MNRNRISALTMLLTLAAPVAWTQAPAAPTKSPQTADENRMSEARQQELLKHWRTKPDQTWSEFIEDWLTPKPFDKKVVVKIDDRYAYPHIVASIKMEIVREDEEHVWLRGIPPEDPESPLYKVWSQTQVQEMRIRQAAEAMATPGAVYFLDFEAEPVPPPFQDALQLEPRLESLPQGGRWQMGFAVADMNGDGAPDLVFPPRRQAYPPRIAILLGDGSGGFTGWTEARWPESLRIDYGGVAVADLDGDGHQDIVLAVHFGPQFVLYGDGKGDFTRSERLPSPDPRIPSRAPVAADFDGDGRPDLAFIAEIDYDISTNKAIEGAATAWVLHRRGSSWEVVSEGLPRKHIADGISAGDIDGDGRADLILSSNTAGERRLVYLNTTEGWRPAPFNGVLSSAYHYDVEAKTGEIYAAFVQFQMVEGGTQARNGLIAYPFAFRAEGWRPGRTVTLDAERTEVFFRIALGDLDGDGRTDIAASRKTGGLELYLQRENGEFVRELAPELAATGTAYDLRLLDLDGDGRDDIVAGMVPAGEHKGGVGVWLSRPRSGS